MSDLKWEYTWATTPETAKKAVWRAHRIDEILAGCTPRPLESQPTVVFHIFTTTPDPTKVQLPTINVRELAPAAGLAATTTRANVDGIIAVGEHDPSYVQVFRDQTVEYASSSLINVPNSDEIDKESLDEFLSNFPHQLLRVMHWNDEPRNYALTLLHVSNHRLPSARPILGFGFDRDTILFPIINAPEYGLAPPQLRRLIREANGALE